MGLFLKRLGTIFLKETSDVTVFIERMQKLLERADEESAKKIEKQINLARYGEFGEKTIAFELKNSGMDMYVLHDIYLEVGELTAQIDYIVITRANNYIIECKNLIGNIDIDNTGAFKRSFELFGKRVKEGIYSPITQNERHLMAIKEIEKNSRNGYFAKAQLEKSFYMDHKSVVVLANPKTCLNARFAPRYIKDQVIRADQLVTYIRQKDASSQLGGRSDKTMLEWANFFLNHNKPERSDYACKYEEIVDELEKSSKSIEEEQEPKVVEKVSENAAIDRAEKIRMLKEFRLKQSREENLKAYYIFNDAQMNALLDRCPRDKNELLQVQGFGNVKVEKYGDKILEILWGRPTE